MPYREPKSDPVLEIVDGVSSLWPLFFWYTCCGCRQQWRREWGWRVQLAARLAGRKPQERFVCGRCAETPRRADQLANAIVPISSPYGPPPKPPNYR